MRMRKRAWRKERGLGRRGRRVGVGEGLVGVSVGVRREERGAGVGFGMKCMVGQGRGAWEGGEGRGGLGAGNKAEQG